MNRYERLNEERKIIEKRKRVAAYCRVSTDNEDQANSFESQQRYFRQYIERNPDWELYEIFADEGISGTSTKKRKEFNRMIACAKNGDFDLIITKEISRFARNTLDSIYYTRDLKKHGVGVIFMNDNINTLDGDAELRLAIMSSIAQEESRKTSERVKWGQKRQMEQGVVFGRSMLGYDVKDGKMTINEEGAKIVRLIFHKFVNEGKGTHVIARELREEGIEPMRVKEWQNTVILRVIRNEKYCGDLVQKKTYTPDFLSHEKKYNRGQEEFVIIKDHHEPIVSRELFEEANRILDERSLSQEGKAKHSNRYPFSGKIKCGHCGASYVARYKTRKDGSKYKAWRCQEAAKHGSPHTDKAGNQIGCTGASIRNEDATHIMFLVTKELKLRQTKITKNLTSIIESIIAMDTTGTDVEKLKTQIATIEDKRTKLIDIYMSGDISKDEFSAARSKCDAEIAELQSVIDSIDKQQAMIRQQQELVQEIRDAINEIVCGVEYDDEFYKHILDKMVVNDKDNIDVYLNLLPMKWSYTVAKASKKALAPERNISGASVPGDYVKKPMKECTGKEITEEWLYHLGVPVEEIEDLAENSAVCVPTMMPYITAFFMPRTKGDRPDVIPDGCVNFAFLGQFADTPRDTVFTTEYSVRTAMEAVYGLLGVDRGVPEVWGSVYDVRELLDSSVKLMDGKSPLEIQLPGPLNALKKPLLKLVKGNVIEKLLRDHDILKDNM